MTDERMFTVPEVARFFGITPQAVRQRIVEGRLEACKVRVKGVAREYRISAGAIKGHYDMSDADMKRLAGETMRYRVGFMGWALGLPFPDYQQVHSTYYGAVAEAKRVLAVLPRFREENSEMERWLPVNFPAEPDKAIVYPDPFDCARFGMDFEHSTVEIIDGVEAVR
jgi:hypothetical protein